MIFFKIDDDKDCYPFSPICMNCAHWDEQSWQKGGVRKCKAFSKEIPFEIWSGKNNHRKPFKGDNGIRFEAVKEKP